MELLVVAPARRELRSVIKFLNAKKIPPIEIHRQLEEVYGEKCMDVKNARKWWREFSAGRLNVHNDGGRPSHSDETVRKVEELVLADRRLTLNELAEKLQEVCSRDSIHSILVNTLQYRKLSARWVPKMLTPEHKMKRVQCAQDFLASFEEEGKEFLDSIVTGDETWVASSDFHMFPALKKHLGGMKFANDEEIHKAVNSYNYKLFK